MTTIDKDLETLANHPWPSFAKSAGVDESGVRSYYDNPLTGKYTYQQYLHARHVLGLDDETRGESNMHPDLEWLARNVSEWLGTRYVSKEETTASWTNKPYNHGKSYTQSQWLQARQDLGLVMTEEEEAMPAEERDYGAEPDMVNKPPHYQLHEGYEVYDLRQDLARKAQSAGVPHDQFSDWDRALEYLLRMWEKNGVEDAKKGAWYVNKLIGKLESSAPRAQVAQEVNATAKLEIDMARATDGDYKGSGFIDVDPGPRIHQRRQEVR